MIKHAIKLAFRTFSRHKASFLINVVGLSTGLACALLIFLWVQDEKNVDQFHDDNLYQVLEHQTYAEGIMTTSSTPGLLARTLKEEIPEIEFAATVNWSNSYTLSVGDKNVKAVGHHAESDFFKLFNFHLIQGSADDVLTDQSHIVLSEKTAQSLFGSTDAAMNQIVELDHDWQYQVVGIFDNLPENSSAQFDVVTPYDRYLTVSPWLESWGNNSPPSYVKLVAGADAAAVSEKIKDFVKDRNEESNVSLFLQPYVDRYLHGRYENGKLSGGRIEYVRLFSMIAIFVLIIACINFMNLSTAQGSQRAKEVGVKKTLGVERKSLIGQYLIESLILSFLSLLIASVIVWLFIPTFNTITDKQIVFSLTPNILLSFLGISTLTGLLAGSYPAIYLSSFKPVKVLKGELKTSIGELWARRGLVVFQFTMSVILILSVLIVYKQIMFVQERNLGYDKDQLVHFSMDGQLEDRYDAFLEEARRLPSVKSVSSIGHDLVGRQNNTSGLKWDGKNPEDRILFENIAVNYDLIETIGAEMKVGRSFSREYGSDTTKIVFNEKAIEVMGFQEDPIGKVIRLWDEYDLEIIGVVKDFHFQSLHENVKPLFFRLWPENTWRIMANIKAGYEQQGIKELQELYERFNPGFPFEYQFVDEEYQRQYAGEQRVARLSRYFAGFAILISCLGLFGLAAFTGERRRKEIGVRKVLGASVSQVVLLLTKDFTKLVGVSIAVGLPVAYFIVRNWLDRFQYRIPMEWTYFLIAGLLVMLVAWITVSTQAYRSAIVNPNDCLRDE